MGVFEYHFIGKVGVGVAQRNHRTYSILSGAIGDTAAHLHDWRHRGDENNDGREKQRHVDGNYRFLCDDVRWWVMRTQRSSNRMLTTDMVSQQMTAS